MTAPPGANGTEPITSATSNRGGGHASPGTPRTHVIKTGETFTSIARSVYGDGRYYLQILKANPGLEPSALKPGTRINLPDLTQQAAGEPRTNGRSSRNTRGGENTGTGSSIDPKTQYKVEQNDSLYKIAEKLYGDGTRMDALYEANKQSIGPDPRKLKLGMILKLPEQPTVASAGREAPTPGRFRSAHRTARGREPGLQRTRPNAGGGPERDCRRRSRFLCRSAWPDSGGLTTSRSGTDTVQGPESVPVRHGRPP